MATDERIHISYSMNSSAYTKMLVSISILNIDSHPLFNLNPHNKYSLSFIFGNKEFTMQYDNKKTIETYNNILECIQMSDCIIILLKNQNYIYLPVGITEKYNCKLYDIASCLKNKCHSRYHKNEELIFPENEIVENIYKAKSNKIAEIRCKPTAKENALDAIWTSRFYFVLSLVWIISLSLLAIFMPDPMPTLLFMLPATPLVVGIVLTVKEYRNNIRISQNGITYTLYQECLVYHMLYGDIDLKYSELTTIRTFFTIRIFSRISYESIKGERGGWNIGLSIMIPLRELKSNTEFDNALMEKIFSLRKKKV